MWAVDWDSQLARLQDAPTPCRLPGGDALADALRAELQVDLEALVNAAMAEMRSWVSQAGENLRGRRLEPGSWQYDGRISLMSCVQASFCCVEWTSSQLQEIAYARSSFQQDSFAEICFAHKCQEAQKYAQEVRGDPL